MATEKISWFYESAADRKKEVSTHTPSFGAYRRDGDKPFNERFEELAAGYLENGKIDVKRDIKKLLADRSFMEQYREDLMEPIISAFEDHFDTTIPTREVWGLHQVKDVIEYLAQKGFTHP